MQTSFLPRPSSTSETKSIEPAPSRQQSYRALETSSAAMQNTAFYGSWPLNLNQYAWSPEALQQYQNMLLTDPTLQPQMHQPPTHQPLQPQPLQLPPMPRLLHPHHRRHHLLHSLLPPLLSPHPLLILRHPTPSPHHNPPTCHIAHQAQHPFHQPGSLTVNTTTATPYMATPYSVKSNPQPGVGHAMFTVWILSYYQRPPCFAKVKRTILWDCWALDATWDSFPRGI